MQHIIKNYFDFVQIALKEFNKSEFEKLVNVLIAARNQNKTIYVMGNGGSGLAASHFVADIGKSASYGKEKRFKVVCLNDNMSMVLSYANDVNYEVIFVEQLKNFLQKGDVVIGFSGSGNSMNVIRAIEYANDNGATTVGFTGFDGGKLKKVAQISLNSNVPDIQVSEDFHLMLIHLIMKAINDLDQRKPETK